MSGIDVVEISGDARQRGEQYGEAARDKVHRAIGFYSEAFVAHSSVTWTEVTERAKRWMPLVEDFAPDLVEELHGIAAGAGTSPLDILALNARGDIVHDHAFASVDPAHTEEGCSSFAVLPGAVGDGKVYCGQNWDWLAGVQDTTLALRIHQPPKPTVVTIVEAGIAVLYAGRVAEIGPSAALSAQPKHPYTQALLSAVPVPHPATERVRERLVLTGEPPSPKNPPSGCRFRTRCPLATAICASEVPPLRAVEDSPDRHAACHHTEQVGAG